LGALAKFIACDGKGLLLEATYRLRKVREVTNSDHGKYKSWEKVLQHFGNLDDATRFINKRRAEPAGTASVLCNMCICMLYIVHVYRCASVQDKPRS